MMEQEIFEGDDEIRADLIQASKEIGREQLKARFEALVIPKEKSSYLRMWMAVAAIAVVLIAAVLLLKPPSQDAIFSDYYTKLPNKVVPITRGSSEQQDLTLAMISYDSGDYQGLLSELEALESANPKVSIYKGMIHLEQENYGLAVEILGLLHEDKNYIFNEDSSWYLALAYLKLDRKDEALEIFTSLSKNSNEYKEKSASILKDL